MENIDVHKALTEGLDNYLWPTMESNLNEWKNKCKEIYDMFLKVPEHDEETKNKLRLQYQKLWNSYIDTCREFLTVDWTYRVPSSPEMSWSILSLFPKKDDKDIKRDGFDKQKNRSIIGSIIDYNIWIQHLMKNKINYPRICWQVIVIVEQMFDLTNMTITPELVLSMIDKAFGDIELYNSIQEPNRSPYDRSFGSPEGMSASAIIGAYRANIISDWLINYVFEFKDKYHRYPNKKEIESYLEIRFQKTNDKKLWLFRDGINYRTLNKFLVNTGIKEIMSHRYKNTKLHLGEI